MARYKEYSYAQTSMVAISYDRYRLFPVHLSIRSSDVIDTLDMSIFDDR